jgi:ATP-dependent Clp protease ATP-binding subunit ClpA/ActR/RegA family two-component response regulator
MTDSISASLYNLENLLSEKVVGQPKAIQKIVPCIQMYQAGLSPGGRPAGVFLLLGATGTGKTKTVEALAEILHGTSRKVVRVDCGEFQTEHEVAKLIGSPPGYIGHRETPPILTQQRLIEGASANFDLTLVLFDEIEKADPSVAKLLLGILDKAVLRLGDNTEVNFEKTLVFFTSNLGARDMVKEMQPALGFRGSAPQDWSGLAERLEGIAVGAVRKMYSPEFVNRIDAVITYQPLDEQSLSRILDQQLMELQNHINKRLGVKCFTVDVSEESRQFLLARGTSAEYGARELKRVIYRYLTQPLATLVIEGVIDPGARVRIVVHGDGERLHFKPSNSVKTTAQQPTLLIVDDNRDFLRLLSLQLGEGKVWRLLTAHSIAEAMQIVARENVDFALLDVMLSDGNGVKLGAELKSHNPNIQVTIMTGGTLTHEDEHIQREFSFRLLEKPFLADDLFRVMAPRRAAATT